MPDQLTDGITAHDDGPDRLDTDPGRNALATLRVGAILTASARIWRRELRSLTLLAAALELPLVVAEITLKVTPGIKVWIDESVTLTASAIVVMLYGSLSHHFLAGLLERVVGSDRRGHPRPKFGEILHDLPWHRLVLADLLLTTMLVAGLALFIIPGLVVLTWFSVTLPIVNLEGNRVLASFVRSYRLVRGHSWRVFAIAMCAFVAPEIVIGAIAGFVHNMTNNVALNAIGHGIPAIVLMPIAALPIVVLAFDLVDLDADAEGREIERRT